jgi:hypothetical protein
MLGLLVFIIAAVWLCIAMWLANLITWKLPDRPWGNLACILALVVLFPLPLIDEIAGKMQFEQLCNEYSEIEVNRREAAGKTVYLAPTSEISAQGTWVPIRRKQWRYLDATTDELVVSYNTFHASGGLLVRTLKLWEGDTPMTFDGYCAPGPNRRLDTLKLMKELNITSIDRDELNDRKFE